MIATGWAEGERYRRIGVRGDRLTRINPAVAPCRLELPRPRRVLQRDVGVPPESELIFAGGRLDAAYGVKDAVIAFDMLRYESPALQLVLTGDGPDRKVAQELGRALAFDDCRVRFSGPHADIAAATCLAEMVWVTCERGGEHLALRAMAAGKPVIAFQTPELAEIIDDGETGHLVPKGDAPPRWLPAGFSCLLADPAFGRPPLGEAGRKRAAERLRHGPHGQASTPGCIRSCWGELAKGQNGRKKAQKAQKKTKRIQCFELNLLPLSSVFPFTPLREDPLLCFFAAILSS